MNWTAIYETSRGIQHRNVKALSEVVARELARQRARFGWYLIALERVEND